MCTSSSVVGSPSSITTLESGLLRSVFGTWALACLAKTRGRSLRHVRSFNPFAGEAWGLSRNDQGVDYDPLKVEPIRAIGAGTIVDIGS